MRRQQAWLFYPFSATRSKRSDHEQKIREDRDQSPYGERFGEKDEVDQLYRELAQVKKSLDTWSFYILTSYPHLEKVLGGRATKRRKLYNGNIETQYYQYYGPRPPRRKD